MLLRRGMWVRVAKGIALEYRVNAKTAKAEPVLHPAKTAVDLGGALGIVTDVTPDFTVIVLQKPDGLTKRRPSWNETRMVDDVYAVAAADFAQAGLGDIPKARLQATDPKRIKALGYK